MKKIIILLASIVAIFSCDKASTKIDPSLVNVEIELSCIDEEETSWGAIEHTILCTGEIGGFTGEATISISPGISKGVTVAGESTSFSFTFSDTSSSENTNKPKTYDVTIIGPNGEEIFQSSVVIYL